MPVSVGTDLIEIERIRRSLARYERFRERCFTEAERAYCDSRPNPAQSYAGRFAGKEAVGKAVGFGVARAFAWQEIEIVGRPKPAVRLSGRLAEYGGLWEQMPIFAGLFLKNEVSYWLEQLEKAGVPCGPVNDFAQVFADPHVRARGMEMP